MDYSNYSSIILIVLINCAVLISAQAQHSNKCKNVTAIKNFNIKQYMGTWYEYQRYDLMAEDHTDCITLNYTLLPDMSFMINNTFVRNNKNVTMTTTVREANVTTHEGILKVQLPAVNQEVTIYIVGTDYTDYSILWGCTERPNNTPMEFAWVLSRNKTLTSLKMSEVNMILQDNNIANNFVKPKHDPLTCWNKNSAAMKNISILLLTFMVTLKYFV